MKKILFFGDSITDAGRNRERTEDVHGLGVGFVRVIADRLLSEPAEKYQIINRGISGNRVVDLYARVKSDCWNLNPDLVSILIGVNDVWHEIDHSNGVSLERFERVYRMLIEDTRNALPNVKLILCEPFILEGWATQNTEEMPNRYGRFLETLQYAQVVRKLAEEYEIPFVSLQDSFNRGAERNGAEYYLSDGVHPGVGGASLIAEEWLKVFKKHFGVGVE